MGTRPSFHDIRPGTTSCESPMTELTSPDLSQPHCLKCRYKFTTATSLVVFTVFCITVGVNAVYIIMSRVAWMSGGISVNIFICQYSSIQFKNFKARKIEKK